MMMMNKSYQYATKFLAGEIVAPAQVCKACENFLYENIVCERVYQ
jgi:hypothetical protein